MTLTKKTRTYALIGTSTGLVLGCASLATGISLFFLETKLEKNLKIYLIILGSIFIIAFTIAIIIVADTKVPSISIDYITVRDYSSTSDTNNCIINIINNELSYFTGINSFTITAKYIKGTNTNKQDINKTIINERAIMFNESISIDILLPHNNTYDITVIGTNTLGNSSPVTQRITTDSKLI